jgi:hypothetical protein
MAEITRSLYRLQAAEEARRGKPYSGGSRYSEQQNRQV